MTFISHIMGIMLSGKKLRNIIRRDTAAIIYWLNNRKSGEWKRKQEGDGNLSDDNISKLKSIALNEAEKNI